MRKFDTHLDFDLELAKTQTPDNPVFYIQYAHARVESIKKTAGDALLADWWKDPGVLSRLSSPHEIGVLRLLSQYEDQIAGAAQGLEPARLVTYLQALAGAFHRFYAEHRVVTEDADLSRARLMLSESVQAVIRSGLGLLGVSAPLKM